MSKVKHLEVMSGALPELLYRHKWKHYAELGAPFTQGTMQNYDSCGKGPVSAMIGGRVCYLKSDFIDWLETR